MNPTIWLVLLIIFLVTEFINMNLYAACFAPGALVAAVLCFLELPGWISIAVFILLSAIMVLLIRPVLARFMNRQKKQARLDRLIGSDAIVICEIVNAHGVGVVNIGGKEYRARSQRPNAIISEGSKVKVVSMRGDTAIVDDLRRTSTGRIDIPRGGFLDDYYD